MCLSGSSEWETQKSISEEWPIKKKGKTKQNLLGRNKKMKNPKMQVW